ncbi:sugar ABC transporter substrate-binding protein [Rhodococcus sp. NPDC057529]|uniref:sugar ABC transporter substrate-binding protein n=1 Tax=Rhodococcus sp. NPDC057529 TaxID=3346158 RepID=UPI00366F5414
MHQRQPAAAILEKKVTRRSLLLGAGALGVTVSATGCGILSNPARATTQTAYSDSELMLVSVIQTSTNDYMQDWAFGSRVYADHVGLPLRVINSNLDSYQEYSQIQSVAATGKKVIVNLTPINSADVPGIAKSVARAGGYLVSTWDKPDGITPQDVGNSWVSHMGYDGIQMGQYIAEKLFESIDGKGGVIALKGPLGSKTSNERYYGLQQALKKFPDIELLGWEAANWDRQTAYDKTRSLLSRFPGKVKGIWTGGDAMALGAVAAAENAGVKVRAVGADGLQEALQNIKSGGPIVATWYTDGAYSGMIGLAIGHAAARGDLDVSSLSSIHRNGTYRQVGVDASNVDEYLTPPTPRSLIAALDKGLYDRLIGEPITGF